MDFHHYQMLSRKTAVYPKEEKIIYPTLGLAGEAGEVCEKVKKVLRDEGRRFSNRKTQEIEKELGDVLWYIANLASDLGIPLERVAQQNLDKLFSRKDRGKLHGSGDNR